MSLEKRISYLGLADYDYLSGRLLLWNGLFNTALPKLAEAFEKILKLLLLLEAKINGKPIPTTKDLKKYSHDLVGLAEDIKSIIPDVFSDQWLDFFKSLADSYDRRYPENWKRHEMKVSLIEIDKAYTYLRNNIINFFPAEEQDRVRDFGTFLDSLQSDKASVWIQEHGGKSPMELLKIKNSSFDVLDIHKE